MPFTPEVASDLIRRTITALAGDDVANKMLRSIESVWGLTRQNTTSDPPVNRDIVITAVAINVRGGFERDAAITIFDKQKRVGTLTSAAASENTLVGTPYTLDNIPASTSPERQCSHLL